MIFTLYLSLLITNEIILKSLYTVSKEVKRLVEKNNKTQRYTGVYQELSEILGEQVAKKLYQSFRGQQVVFPMRLYTRDYVKDVLSEQYNGHNLKVLAKEFGYTERYLRTLLKQL